MTFAQNAHDSILGAIGNTPIVRLNSVTKGLPANVYGKCEFMNPGGSIKDRIGVHIIDVAEREGLLKPGGTIIEATSGNTGMGLAMTAAVRGYKCIFVMADKQSEEKRTALRSVGAQVVICPTNVEPDDPRSYYRVADRLAAETPNSFYANQYYNPANPESHYISTGPEIWKQCGSELDVLVLSIGTGGTVSGITKYLREKNPNIQVVGVDPIGSIFYELFHTGKTPVAHSYYVEGIGEDFMPGTMTLSHMNDIVQVSDRESFSMARRLIREEGLLIGGSSGSAVMGAIKYVKERLKWTQSRKPNILVILPDSSSRYLSKFLNDEWLRDAGLIDREPIGGTIQDILRRKEAEMQTKQVYTCDYNDPLGIIVDRMKEHDISQLPVLKEGALAGLVSEVQVLSALVSGSAAMNSPIGPLADSNGVAAVTPATSLSELADHFGAGKVAAVINEGNIVGLITKIDLITHLKQARP
jgi:cystathionine beta-synthase